MKVNDLPYSLWQALKAADVPTNMSLTEACLFIKRYKIKKETQACTLGFLIEDLTQYIINKEKQEIYEKQKEKQEQKEKETKDETPF